jgi:hypothetical protein
MLCKSCRSSHMEYNKISFCIFRIFLWFYMDFTRLGQKLQSVMNLFASRPLERFESSQIYPWFAQKSSGSVGGGDRRIPARTAAELAGEVGKTMRDSLRGRGWPESGLGWRRRGGSAEVGGGRRWSLGSYEPVVWLGQQAGVGDPIGPREAA